MRCTRPDRRERPAGTGHRRLRALRAIAGGWRPLAAACALGLWAAAGSPARSAGDAEDVFWLEAPPGPAAGMRGSLAELVEPLEASVVALAVERVETRPDPLLGIRRRGAELSAAFGSAFVISRDGYALTAEPLVAGARRIRAQLADGRRVLAQLVGRDSRSRLALLKLGGGGSFVPAPLGDSDAPAIGDWVIALGHSDERTWDGEQGVDRSPTLAKGIISGRGRRVDPALARLIQTDLVLVDGYSGAPLFDMNGRVIGVIDRELQPPGALGISFAIPIHEAKQVLGQLRAAGRVRHGWLGMELQELNPGLVKRLGLESNRGALVVNVLADTPAEHAHILRLDVILEVAGTRIEQRHDVLNTVAALRPGTQVPLVVLRDGKRQKLAAVLGAQPEDPLPPHDAPPPLPKVEPWGFAAEVLTPDLARRYGFEPNTAGLVVTSVDPLSPADRAELVAGDLLREANGIALQTLPQLESALASEEPLLRVQRGTSTVYRVLQRDRE